MWVNNESEECLMKALSMLFSVILGIALLGILTAGCYFGVKFVGALFEVLDPQTAVMTIIASVTAFLCAVLIYRGFTQIGQKEVKAQMRLEKANLYERVLLLWGVKLNSKTASVDPAVEEELQQLAQLLTLRGSPKVLKAYLELLTLERTGGLHSPDIAPRFVAVQMAMRKDLGLSTQNLQAEDFLPLLFSRGNVVPEPSKAQQHQDIAPRVSLAAGA
jgi:hypothetical protein